MDRWGTPLTVYAPPVQGPTASVGGPDQHSSRADYLPHQHHHPSPRYALYQHQQQPPQAPHRLSVASSARSSEADGRAHDGGRSAQGQPIKSPAAERAAKLAVLEQRLRALERSLGGRGPTTAYTGVHPPPLSRRTSSGKVLDLVQFPPASTPSALSERSRASPSPRSAVSTPPSPPRGRYNSALAVPSNHNQHPNAAKRPRASPGPQQGSLPPTGYSALQANAGNRPQHPPGAIWSAQLADHQPPPPPQQVGQYLKSEQLYPSPQEGEYDSPAPTAILMPSRQPPPPIQQASQPPIYLPNQSTPYLYTPQQAQSQQGWLGQGQGQGQTQQNSTTWGASFAPSSSQLPPRQELVGSYQPPPQQQQYQHPLMNQPNSSYPTYFGDTSSLLPPQAQQLPQAEDTSSYATSVHSAQSASPSAPSLTPHSQTIELPLPGPGGYATPPPAGNTPVFEPSWDYFAQQQGQLLDSTQGETVDLSGMGMNAGGYWMAVNAVGQDESKERDGKRRRV